MTRRIFKGKGNRVDRESPIQEAIVRFLDFALPGTVRVVGVSNNARSPAAGAKEKRKGMVAGYPDLTVMGTDHMGAPFLAFIEVKTEAGRLSKPQKEWQDWCNMAGLHYAVCRSVDDAKETLDEWNLL
jgi:hypothetical protein